MTKTRRLVPGRVPRGSVSSLRRPAAGTPAGQIDDTFFRHIVAGMRNGVLAITWDGTLALINDEAYRIFGTQPRKSDLGTPLAEVLTDHPDVVRVLMSAFDLHLLPNRVEMRLKPSNKVIGYTLALVRSDDGAVIGAAMFFKDLTRVEQLEERERLRDRLAALGEMAAAIAHEVKNPLAGIEVMAGLLKRRLPDSQDAQTVLADIIKEAKMANRIVQEVLAFVRPIRLQVEDISVSDVIRDAIAMAESHSLKGDVEVRVEVPEALRPLQGDPHQLRQLFTNLVSNAFEALDGRGTVT